MAVDSLSVATAGLDCVRPAWAAPDNIRALATTCLGGESRGGYAALNLGDHVGDDPVCVAQNRARLITAMSLPAEPRWLTQVHGTAVVHADSVTVPVEADAAWSASTAVVCAVLTADCLPVLFCTRDGQQVAAAHAGWRGLCAGVLEQTVNAFLRAGFAAADILVWLGPAIGAAAYEVDSAVRDAFIARDPELTECFSNTRPEHWSLDLYAAARALLAAQGVREISGGDLCTFSDARFYSYRRAAQCGRQATLIWRQA